jgi:hypothetical protein
VSVVEVTTFQLAAGTDVESFLRSDRRVQTELVPNQPGFLRRTTARRGADWLVVVLWASQSDASAFHESVAAIRCIRRRRNLNVILIGPAW